MPRPPASPLTCQQKKTRSCLCVGQPSASPHPPPPRGRCCKKTFYQRLTANHRARPHMHTRTCTYEQLGSIFNPKPDREEGTCCRSEQQQMCSEIRSDLRSAPPLLFKLRLHPAEAATKLGGDSCSCWEPIMLGAHPPSCEDGHRKHEACRSATAHFLFLVVSHTYISSTS